jgi:hypothetical protein
LGSEILKWLYREMVIPLTRRGTKGEWYRGLRFMALDGSTLELQDTKANVVYSGRVNGGGDECAFNKLRFVALVEVGMRVLWGVRMGAFGTNKKALDEEVLGCYWAVPETDYTHIATQLIRRLDLIWQGDNVSPYEQLKQDIKIIG